MLWQLTADAAAITAEQWQASLLYAAAESCQDSAASWANASCILTAKHLDDRPGQLADGAQGPDWHKLFVYTGMRVNLPPAWGAFELDISIVYCIVGPRSPISGSISLLQTLPII